MTTLAEAARAHADCSLVACLNPLHPGPCKGWKGTPEEAFERVAGRAKKGIRAYNKTQGVKGGGTSKKALLSYVNGSGPINRSLRASKGSGSNDPKVVAEIAAMDRAMSGSKLTHPITVQRAVSPSAFGGRDTNVDLTGAEYIDHAFGSTGTDLNLILKHFHTTSSGKKPLIADITVPAGMGAIRVPPGQWGDEKEILLDRGAHYRIVKDNGYISTTKGKFRHITLEVVPGQNGKVQQVDLGEKNQQHRDSVTASTGGRSGEKMPTLGEMHFGFNPLQKRGSDGKWIFVGAAVTHAEHGVGEVTDTHVGGKVSVRFGRGVGVKKVDKGDIKSATGATLGDMKAKARARIAEVDEIIKTERHERESRDKIVKKMAKNR